MRALNRKLARDLWRLRGQVLAIALVVAGGVATYVIAHGTMHSLELTQREFYRESRFADVFASLVRAPRSVEARIAGIPGVEAVATRVAAAARVQVPYFDDPVGARVLSLPDPRTGLNRLDLRTGRLPESAREVAVNEAFAEAHGLQPGDRLDVTLHGRGRALTVTGIVLSAEFVYLLRPGELFPDYRRYGVLWMVRAPLAAAAGLDGAFNDVLLRLAPGADPAPVIAALDRLLQPYGSTGAFGRADQVSHRYLTEEVRQWEAQATLMPAIFLGVAAFLLHLVLARLLRQERSQVAVLRAFGYSGREIAVHYLLLAGAIIALGVFLGIAAGGWLGRGMAVVYQEFFRFPYLHYALPPDVMLSGALVSALAGLAGAALAVRAAGRVPPAEGMRPEPPPRYRKGRFDAGRLRRWLAPETRMVARHLARQPVKAGLTVLGIALSVSILVVGGLGEDAIEVLMDVQFRQSLRADLSVGFDEIRPGNVRHALAAQPGVHTVEPFRAVAVRLTHGHRSARSAIQGFEPDARLSRLVDERHAPIRLPPEGLFVTEALARKLGAGPGAQLGIEVLEGRRPRVSAPIAGLTHELIGTGVYMTRGALNRLLGEGDVASGAFLGVARDALPGLLGRLDRMPRVAGVTDWRTAARSFLDLMAGNILIFAAVLLALASVIAVGVVYNSVRVTFSERARELASLRVLGYTRTEVGVLLLGEVGVLVLGAIPCGWLIGWALSAAMVAQLETDLYRVPLVIESGTYAYASLMVLAAAILASTLMVRFIRRLDLVSALKVPQ